MCAKKKDEDEQKILNKVRQAGRHLRNFVIRIKYNKDETASCNFYVSHTVYNIGTHMQTSHALCLKNV